jgi:integrase
MKGLEKRGKLWRVRIAIPHDLRVRWGKREEVVSLKTADDNEAITRAAPVIAAIKRRIADLRRPSADPDPVNAPAMARLTIPQTHEAIRVWRHREIENAYLDAFNGLSLATDPVGSSALRYSLQHHSTIDRIADFDAKVADVLAIPADHPVLQRANVREWFREAWSDVEGFRDRFARDDFNGWPEQAEETTATPIASTPLLNARPESRLTPLELYDKWASVGTIKLEARNRGYVKRLQEFLGPKVVGEIEPHDLARFKVAALGFPNTKRLDVLALPFPDILVWAKGEGRDAPVMEEVTIWKWINTLNGMFAYAVKNRWIEINPAADTMTKPLKKRNARMALDPADITEVFSRPLFTGFDGRTAEGYRETPGSTVVKDAKYWLPIVALFTGARLEEIGSTLVSEIQCSDGIWFFNILDRGDEGDQHDRSIKNDQSRRVVPLHSKLIDLGFLDYVKSQPATGFLFPDLTPSKTPYGMKQTPMFSKWYGRFRERNANVKGAGMAHPKKPFHSFRHTAIRALRQNNVNPALSYLLVGHEAGEIDRMNFSYGEGADLKTLKETIDMIDYPTFTLTA